MSDTVNVRVDAWCEALYMKAQSPEKFVNVHAVMASDDYFLSRDPDGMNLIQSCPQRQILTCCCTISVSLLFSLWQKECKRVRRTAHLSLKHFTAFPVLTGIVFISLSHKPKKWSIFQQRCAVRIQD